MVFDIHSHIIYQIDDGARSQDESMKLIRSAVSQGAEGIFATPHYYLEAPSHPVEIRMKLDFLRERCRKEELSVALYEGNEVLYFESMPEALRNGEILTLAGSRYTLIEFYPMESYQVILRAVRNIRRAGYRPIIAHAERFQGLRNHGLSEVISLGGYIQVSTEPLGKSGFSALMDGETGFVRDAIRKRQVHFLGTDMHREDKRPPVLAKAIRWIETHEPEQTEALFRGNVKKLIEDKELV
ncbi:hypothetical protein BXO88_14490 [Oribacterium sp. C9]|uniref:CpsB/CapC family capsule biosynthesis tyrosine phosphatase n=1 Tax=Oribacterium sp. C9 TaxID=1943579 RepID=UPI00098F7DB6|nr:CpsB/CapC family capsule biosynthesis tyrosine phosphatase [Oribacterium sp. C9]OON84993.1 hypothetical protein BXO88_14490 [Oribacterium sp. C9]